MQIPAFKIVSMERKPFSSMFSRATHIHVATVEMGDCSVTYSQIEGEETEWLADSLFRRGRDGKGWVPSFVHGIGSRSCTKHAPAEEIAKALDAKQKENEQTAHDELTGKLSQRQGW